MKHYILSMLFLCLAFFAQAQFRMVSNNTPSWTSQNDSTYTASISFSADQTGFGYLANQIDTTFRLFTGTEQLYRVDSVWNASFSSADLRVVEISPTNGSPAGQVMVFNPDGRETLPAVPLGSTGSTAQLQAAVVSWNARQDEFGGQNGLITELPKGATTIDANGNAWTIDTAGVIRFQDLDGSIVDYQFVMSPNTSIPTLIARYENGDTMRIEMQGGEMRLRDTSGDYSLKDLAEAGLLNTEGVALSNGDTIPSVLYVQAAQAAAESFAASLAFASGSYTTIDTTVNSDYTVAVFNEARVTSFCDGGIDNTISLPTPVDSLKGNIIEITHLDTSLAQSRTTTVEADGTSYHLYNNFTGDTLTFFNIYQSGQTVRFTLQEIAGGLRWVAVDLSPVVFGDKELTAVGKIRQGADGDMYAYDGSVSGERKVQYQYTVDSVEEILSLKLELGDRIKVKGTGAEYAVESTEVSGYTTDSIAVIPNGSNFAKLKGMQIDFSVFGAEYGVDKKENQWKKNLIAFRNAINYSDIIGCELILSDVLEIYSGYVNRYIIQKNGVRILGVSDKATLDFFPKTALWSNPNYSLRYLETTVGKDISIKNVNVYGDSLRVKFQTYDIYNHFNGNSRQIKIRDTEEVWSGLWSNLKVGDTLLVERDYTLYATNTTSREIVESIDSVNRVIVSTTDIIGSQADSLISTHVGILWPNDRKINADTILKYSENWVQSTNQEKYFILASDIETRSFGRVEIDNCDIVEAPIYSSGEIVTIDIKNSKLTGASVLIGIYCGETPDSENKNLILDNVEVYSVGTELTGGGNYNGRILGGAIYLHPNVPMSINNSIFRDNICATVRQYSASGAANRPSKDYFITNIENSSFINNGEYHLATGSHKVIVRNCKFINGTINPGNFVTFDNCEFRKSGISRNGNFLYATNNSFLRINNSNFLDSSAINMGTDLIKTVRDSMDIVISNSHFEISEGHANIFGGSSKNYGLIDNCTWSINKNMPAYIGQDPEPNRAVFLAAVSGAAAGSTGKWVVNNLRPIKPVDSTYNIMLVQQPRNIATDHIIVKNSDLTGWMYLSYQSTGYSSAAIQLYNTITKVNCYGNPHEINDLPKKQTSAFLKNKTVTLTPSGNTAYVETSTPNSEFNKINYVTWSLPNSVVIPDTALYVEGINDDINLIFSDTVKLIPYSLGNTNGNIVANDTTTLLPFEKYKFLSRTYYPLSDTASIDGVSDTLFTADGTNQAYQGDIGSPSGHYIPGSMFLRSSDGGKWVVHQNGKIEQDASIVYGAFIYRNGRYGIEFTSPPDSGVIFWIESKRMLNPDQRGYWVFDD